MDMNDRMVFFSDRFTNHAIDIQGLDNGAYVIQMTGNNRMYVSRFIKAE